MLQKVQLLNKFGKTFKIVYFGHRIIKLDNLRRKYLYQLRPRICVKQISTYLHWCFRTRTILVITKLKKCHTSSRLWISKIIKKENVCKWKNTLINFRRSRNKFRWLPRSSLLEPLPPASLERSSTWYRIFPSNCWIASA